MRPSLQSYAQRVEQAQVIAESLARCKLSFQPTTVSKAR
jgi:hypothetical protein